MSEKTTLHERALNDAANEVILERWRHPQGPAMTIPEQADIVDRLRFDAARCEVDYSKGIAENLIEAANEIERLRALVGVERAAPPLRAREEIARLHEILKELAEPLNYRQFTKWNPQALASEALTILSRTAGQEWRDISDKLADALRHFNAVIADEGGFTSRKAVLTRQMASDALDAYLAAFRAPPIAEPIVADQREVK
jgi:hypothetical protein